MALGGIPLDSHDDGRFGAGYVGTIELILLATIGEWTGHGGL